MLWNAKNGEIILGEAKMSYVSFGQGKHTLILLPGLSDGLTTVQGKALLLARPYRSFFQEYTVYMFSRKDDMPECYSIRDMAKDQALAMHTLSIEKACVMGVSQGGMIAQYLAIDHPDLMEKLILAVTAPCVNDLIKSNVTKWMNLAMQGKHKELMIDTAEKSYSPTYLKKYRKYYPIIGVISKPANYHRFLVNAKAILEFDATGELDKITCPTFIIGGEDDKTVGIQASHSLNERITGSTLYVYAGLGHAAYEEAPDFNQRVSSFLKSEI